MHPPHLHTYTPTAAEAGAWADVLVRYRLLCAAVLAPTGQWLVQYDTDGPVHVLDGPAPMVELAAEVQRRIRTTRNPAR